MISNHQPQNTQITTTKQNTTMKTIAALLLTTTFTLAGIDRPANQSALSTKTKKFGNPKTIEVVVQVPEDKPITLTITKPADVRKVFTRTFDAGSKDQYLQVRVHRGWRASVSVDGVEMDAETDNRRTGTYQRPRK